MLSKLLTGKTAIVTGSNKGMGYEVALTLASRGAKVIMADKCDQTNSRAKIVCQTHNEDVHDEHLDLASFKSVRCFARKILDEHHPLDILVNNAGVFCMDKKLTKDGMDGVMQTNHLGPFLLTNLLSDALKESPAGRIVFVTSNGAFLHNMTLCRLSKPCYFPPHYVSGALHYYNSKLCNMIASKVLARKLLGSNVTSNSVHPGMTSTEFLVCNANVLKKYLTLKVLRLTTKDVKDAAAHTTFMATSSTLKNVTGKYFDGYQARAEPKVLEDEEFCEDVWDESARLCCLKEETCVAAI